MRTPAGPASPGARRRLGFAAAGVLLGAVDTYVVVIALPAIMASVGIDLAHLQEAAPIISGFLLGYVAVLPLLGRLSDIFGRGPVLAFCLLAFAAGSLLTASANTLWVIVVGRTVQGAGGGGLVPVTLALVADLWPPRRRGVPLGVVGAVQEIGSVVGPLYGAALTTVSTWRAIFYINMPLAAIIAAGVWAPGRRSAASRRPDGRADVAGWVLAVLFVVAAVLAIASPPAFSDSLTIGVAFAPLVGGAGLTAPVALVALVSAAAFVVRELTVAPTVRAAVPLRGIGRALGRVDWPGALLIAIVLGAVVVVFASADPATGVVGSSAPVLLPVAALLTVLFVVRELRVGDPLIDIRALRHRAAAGSLLTSLAAGAALMAALVDIPVFARATVDPDSQVQAALVLARLLVAVPLGAVVGGVLADRVGYRAVAGAGLLIAGASFVLMAGWSQTTLADGFAATAWLHPSDPVLVAAGLGFGLAIVPVTAAILGAVPPRLHGVAASLTVAARLVGMLAGLSVLTAVGLRRFYSVQAMLPQPITLCPTTPLHCPAYDALVTGAVVDELHVIFLGAAACALAGALLAVALLRNPAEPPVRLAVAA
ncbi:MAG TPA: MFS transporter [Candidatus Dormibacteraeota bacterium]|nr:MFS transporter [Candidatus Dormibacteraeota bacterium]